MTQFDTEINTHIEESQPLTAEVQHDMDDHEMLIHHVAQHDHELYALDCALCAILGA